MAFRNPGRAVLVAMAVGVSVGVGSAVRTVFAQAAQDAPPQRIQVTITQLKPDMQLTWDDLVKNELLPVQKKANVPWRQTYANGPFGQGFTRVVVTPVANYAQFDLPGLFQRAATAEAGANYNAKIRPAVVNTQSRVMTLQPNNSIQSNSAAPPVLIVVQTAQLLPGKGADFNASMTQDYLPAFKKAGVKDLWVYGTNQGGPGGQITMVRLIQKYADLDQPGLLQQAGLAGDAVQKINARRNALLASGIETEVYRYMPELSFGTPTAPRSTN